MKNEMTVDTVATVRQLADRLRNAKAALAEAQAEHDNLVECETAEILAGVDPVKHRAKISASNETIQGRLRAVDILEEALEEARERDQPAAIRAYSNATSEIQTRASVDLDKVTAKLKGLLAEAGVVMDKANQDLQACSAEHREAFGAESGSRWVIDFMEQGIHTPRWFSALRENLPRE